MVAGVYEALTVLRTVYGDPDEYGVKAESQEAVGQFIGTLYTTASKQIVDGYVAQVTTWKALLPAVAEELNISADDLLQTHDGRVYRVDTVVPRKLLAATHHIELTLTEAP